MTTATGEMYVRDQSFIEKLVRRPLFWIVFTFLGFSYPIYRSVNRELPAPPPVYGTIPKFELTNEYGQKFGSKDLKGKLYIANFFFTSCPSVCPKEMKKMVKIQKRLRGLGTNVAILSFTVDPETDTPNELLKYSRKLKTNPHIWSLLTGSYAELTRVVVDGFKVPMTEKNPELGDIGHSQKIVLVDKKGNIRGYYSTDKASIDQLMIETGLLANNSYREI